MCSKASGLFCACLVSCIVHHCVVCQNCVKNHHGNSVNCIYHINSNDVTSAENSSSKFIYELFKVYGHNNSALSVTGLFQLLGDLGINVLLNEKAASSLSTMHNGQSVSPEVSQSVILKVSSITSKNTTALPDPPSAELLESVENTSSPDVKIQNSSPSEGTNVDICSSLQNVLQSLNVTNSEGLLSYSDFYYMCPAIVYHMKKGHERCVKHVTSNKRFHIVSEEPGVQAWWHVTVAVFVLSICGLLAVLAIPLIQKFCYKYLLQFLVALAIGTLSGDALLHLLPHAMMINENESGEKDGTHAGHENDHNKIVWHSFTALSGIYFFLIMERLLNHFISFRKLKHSTQQKVIQKVPKYVKPLEDTIGDSLVGEKLSHQEKHGSYGYKFAPIKVAETESQSGEKIDFYEKEKIVTGGQVDSNESLTIEAGISELNAVTESVKNNVKSTDENDASHHMRPLHVVTYLPSEKQQNPETPTEECHTETVVYRHAHNDHSYVVTVTDHHTHHHGHNHEIPNSVSSVAWMILMTDGLHNFCDGLAVGAAFGSSLSGGISTSVAVLCHEIPHELGDFALLLKAGMSLKQAVLYNAISSILCFLGALIGVSLGNIHSATGWLFAAAGGMFLYVALVDLLPELSTFGGYTKTEGCRQLCIEFMGIFIGTVIMLLIALYEHDLHHIVS